MAELNQYQQQDASELADDLAMYAMRIREAAESTGALPDPSRLDEWMTCYRDLYRAATGSIVAEPDGARREVIVVDTGTHVDAMS